MEPQYAQGVDCIILLSNFTGFTLMPGDTVRGQFRYRLSDRVILAEIGIANVTGVIDTSAQTILITIPEAVNTTWSPPTNPFSVFTTLLIVSSTQYHRLAINLETSWIPSYTRGISA